MRLRHFFCTAGMVVLVTSNSQATEVRESIWQPAQDSTTWRMECGACHMAFPPSLLPADAWINLLARLDRHFGADATVEAGVSDEIVSYLKQNAGSGSLVGSPDVLPRFTTSDRFMAKHRGALRLLRKGQIKALTDCAACHTEAAGKD